VRAVHASARLARHTFTSVVQAVLIVGIIASLVMAYAAVSHQGPAGADQVFAGKGSGKSGGGGGGKPKPGSTSGSLRLVMVDDADGNGAVTVGDSVTYDTSNAGVPNPFVTTKCYQNGILVLSQVAGFYDSYMWPSARTILLTNENWTSGAGNCTADLYGTTVRLSYNVGA
jgi:hypothetical protein